MHYAMQRVTSLIQAKRNHAGPTDVENLRAWLHAFRHTTRQVNVVSFLPSFLKVDNFHTGVSLS